MICFKPSRFFSVFLLKIAIQHPILITYFIFFFKTLKFYLLIILNMSIPFSRGNGRTVPDNRRDRRSAVFAVFDKSHRTLNFYTQRHLV